VKDQRPLTPAEFRERWQISKATYHELVNTGRLRQTEISERVRRILPEDEQAFIESCREKDTAA